METRTCKEGVHFAYSNVDYDRPEIRSLKNLNSSHAYTSQNTSLAPASLNESYTIPRFGILEGASKAENICRMAGIWHPMMQKLSPRSSEQPKKEKEWFKDLLRGEDHIQKLDI